MAGTASGTSSGEAGGFVDLLSSIFGSSQAGKTTASGTAEIRVLGEDRERLEISDEAIDKIIRDVLGGATGLASIFAGEQNAGVFNSSVSAQAAGDLSANIIGEIAKLRAEKVTTTDKAQAQEQRSRSDTSQEDGGLIGAISNLFGF